MNRILLLAFYAAVSVGTFAQDKNNAELQSVSKNDEAVESFFNVAYANKPESRFQPYGVNSVVWQSTTDDQSAAEGHYSFLYTVYDCRRKKGEIESNCITDDWYFKPSLFLSFTGEFDFYMGSRNSSPVINRMSNPAAHLFIRTGHEDNSNGQFDDPFKIRFFDIGIEHRSNGQVVEIDEMEGGVLKTQLNYSQHNYEYFDSLSRGSNYVSFTVGTFNKSAINWRLGAKAYYSQNAEVNWGPLAGTGVSIDDYDLFNLSIDQTWWNGSGDPSFAVKANYTMGKKGFETDSIEIMLINPVRLFSDTVTLPLMFKIHHGPFDTLSNYTKSVTSWGLGLAFKY